MHLAFPTSDGGKLMDALFFSYVKNLERKCSILGEVGMKGGPHRGQKLIYSALTPRPPKFVSPAESKPGWRGDFRWKSLMCKTILENQCGATFSWEMLCFRSLFGNYYGTEIAIFQVLRVCLLFLVFETPWVPVSRATSRLCFLYTFSLCWNRKPNILQHQKILLAICLYFSDALGERKQGGLGLSG